MRVIHDDGSDTSATPEWEISWKHNGGVPVLYLVYPCGAFTELHITPDEFVNIVRSAPMELKLAYERSRM